MKNRKSNTPQRTHTAKEREKIIAEYFASGLSPWSYSKKLNISSATLYNWLKRKKASKRSKSVSFAKAEINVPVLSNPDMVILANGLKLSIGSRTPVKRVVDLVNNLREIKKC